MCLERLAVAHKTSVPLVRHLRSLPRKAEHPRSYGTAGAQLVKFVVGSKSQDRFFLDAVLLL